MTTHVSSNAVHGKKFNLPQHQTAVVPGKHQLYILPAQGQSSFSAVTSFQCRTEKGKIFLPYAFELQCSALSGVTDTSGTPALLPASFWVSRLELYANSSLIQTLYPTSSWASRNAFGMDSDAENLLYQTAAGELSQAARATKSGSANSWYLFLPSLFFAKTRYLNLPNIDLEFRLTFRSLSELVSTTGTLGGTPVCTINSLKLLVKDTDLPENLVQNATALIRKAPHHHAFSQIKTFTQSVPALTTTLSSVLTGITGTVQLLAFILRPTPTANNNETNYYGVTDFNLLDGNGACLVGADKITAAQYAAAIVPPWVKTSFFTNYPNFYIWSFALSPSEVVTEGSLGTGSHVFSGSEQLVLNFPSSSSAMQLDVYAWTSAVVEQSLTSLGVYQL